MAKSTTLHTAIALTTAYEHHSITINELADMADISRTAAHRILTNLVKFGFMVCDVRLQPYTYHIKGRTTVGITGDIIATLKEQPNG